MALIDIQHYISKEYSDFASVYFPVLFLGFCGEALKVHTMPYEISSTPPCLLIICNAVSLQRFNTERRTVMVKMQIKIWKMTCTNDYSSDPY